MKRLLATFLFLLFSQHVTAKISVSVDRDPVVKNESFQLIFESDEKINALPDFSPLKQSLSILNTSNRTSTKIINTDVVYSQQWILTVLPKTTGRIQIPAIRFGKTSSQPLSIQVEASSSNTGSKQNDNVFLKVETNTTEPYVQAQLIYTVKLYRAITTNNANLTDPQVSGGQAVINQLDADKSYEARINGKRYGVFERRYAIFPQTSGPLTIEPVVFQARSGADSFMFFDPFGPKQDAIVRQSEVIELDVKPIPNTYTGDTWLPAENINIQEQWSLAPDKLKQGEVVTRTLTLHADGLVASNLPAITEQLPGGFKHYPDQPEFEETSSPKGFVGVRHEKMAVIPTADGEFVLPAIRIPWWNTKTDQLEVAELPERIIHVAENSTVNQTDDVLKVNPERDEKLQTKTDEVSIETALQNSVWPWVSAILLLLWLLTLYAWYRARNEKNKNTAKQDKRLSINSLKKNVFVAARDNHAGNTQAALLAWANAQWTDQHFTNIAQLKPYVDKELQEELDRLNSALYGRQQGSWQGEHFLLLFEQLSFAKGEKEPGVSVLEPLYKT